MRKTLIALLFGLSIISSVAQFKLQDKGAVLTLKVQEVATHKIFYSQNEALRLIPASLTKIITSATALELLGPDYTYDTPFYYTGMVKKGKLWGDLLIKSSGDPTLGSKYFEQTAPELLFGRVIEELKRAGINSVEGTVRIESSEIPYSAPRLWEDMGNYYGASPKGFNWIDNTAVVSLRSARVGSVCSVVGVKPDISPYTIFCKVVAASHNKDSAYVYGVDKINQWWIEGSIPQNRPAFKIKAALPNPAHAFRNALIKFMNDNGVAVQRDAWLTKDRVETLLFTYHSPALSQMIKNINHVSNNLSADQLLLTLAEKYRGKASWDFGNEVVRSFWRDKIDFEQNFRLRDGSGLTPKNLVSADGMVQLLLWMQENSLNYAVYAQSLAKGGETGTLRSVFKHPKVKGKVIGKSGSMEGVLGYCGYMTTSSGKRAAFCVMANNYLIPTHQVREWMDDIFTNFILEE